MPRLFVDLPLADFSGAASLALPPRNARHVQVLRLQPGDPVTLFDGRGGEWAAQVLRIGRNAVEVRLQGHAAVEREIGVAAALAIGMPANERMDTLVEKATELGAARIQPLMTGRSVLRLSGERAERKRVHWQAVAVAACEQCGRNRVPDVTIVQDFGAWLSGLTPEPEGASRWLLSPDGAPDQHPWAEAPEPNVLLLSGPEGGFTPTETALAHQRGFRPLSLGPRVLRADTAPLAALAWLSLAAGPR